MHETRACGHYAPRDTAGALVDGPREGLELRPVFEVARVERSGTFAANVPTPGSRSRPAAGVFAIGPSRRSVLRVRDALPSGAGLPSRSACVVVGTAGRPEFAGADLARPAACPRARRPRRDGRSPGGSAGSRRAGPSRRSWPRAEGVRVGVDDRAQLVPRPCRRSAHRRVVAARGAGPGSRQPLPRQRATGRRPLWTFRSEGDDRAGEGCGEPPRRRGSSARGEDGGSSRISSGPRTWLGWNASGERVQQR